MVDYWLSFLAGLFSSLHCAGMCGAIVLAYSLQNRTGTTSPGFSVPPHLVYNGGRVLSYTLIGILLGMVGGGIYDLRTVGHWFSICLGVVLVLSGIFALKIIPQIHLPGDINFTATTNNIFYRLFRATFGRLLTAGTYRSQFLIGFITPLLPCGILYAMFLKAAGTGDAFSGGLTMMMFGLGIVPSLFIVGITSSFFGAKSRKIGEALAAITIIIMGIMLIMRAFGPGRHQMP